MSPEQRARPTTPPPPVTLNVTLTPGDWRHAEHVLPHQLRQWAGQVDEVQLVLNDPSTAPGGGAPDAGQRRKIETVLEEASSAWPHVHVREVDYSPAARAETADCFYGGQPVPLQNHDGGPFYSYWYGWCAARHDLILHTDSDMLFGGGSQTWVAEALTVLAGGADLMAVSPLPGPPTRDGELPPVIRAQHARWGGEPVREPHSSLAYRLHGVSTRLWLFDRVDLVRRLGPMPLDRPPLRSRARARLEGNPPFQLPEQVLTALMNRRGLRRVDLLGSDPGMWSLHPALRSEEFYAELPRIVARVETGDVPEAQRGDYDVNDSLVDWTSARAAKARRVGWRRVGRAAASALRR